MRMLFGIFLCFALVGAVTGLWLPMIVIGLVLVCSYWAKILLDVPEDQWGKDPEHPVTTPDTMCMLTRYDCECMSSKADPRFPRQTSEPDLEI